jgi:hypothetical protein
MGAHLCAMGADLAELNLSAPKIADPLEGSPRCRLRTSRISESWHGALASRQVWVKCEELRASIMSPLPPQLPTFERHRFSTAAISPHRIDRSDGERSDRAC